MACPLRLNETGQARRPTPLTAAFGLVGISPTDPLTFGFVASVLAASAVLGCAIPARRAMRIDPAIALRHE
jgi:ABC-type antimicrobial peptide transport system permease subunit